MRAGGYFSRLGLQLFLIATVNTLAIASQPAFAQVSPENRPAFKLIRAGVLYSAPLGWRVEDEPDLNGVLLLEPAKPGSKTWRSRILVELNERPDTQLSGLSLPAQAAHRLVSVLKPEGAAKADKQSLVQHPSGFSYGLYESKQTRQKIDINETRMVVMLADNQRLVITASCYQSECETFKPVYDTFIRGLILRKN